MVNFDGHLAAIRRNEPVPTVADCLWQHAPAYLQRFGKRLALGHRKVIDSITRCRTGALGGVKYECQQCGRCRSGSIWVGQQVSRSE